MLRIKELCKSKGITLSELAERSGMSQAGLSQAIGRDSKISTLQKIATALNVPISELFEKPKDAISGFLELNGEVYKINSFEDVFNVLKKKSE